MTSNSQSGMRMQGYLPSLYERCRVVQDLLHAQGFEVDAWRGALNEVLNQFFVRSATWGLEVWERELGLPPAATQSEDERRDRIVSHLRGYGTATIAVVKWVAEAYERGTVDIVQDAAAYRVIVRFVDTRGVPDNLEDLKVAVRAVVPAHLDILYEFRYLTWNEFDAMNMTWDEFDALGITWDELEVLT